MIPGIVASYPDVYKYESTTYSIGIRTTYGTAQVYRYNSLGQDLPVNNLPTILPGGSMLTTAVFGATSPSNLPPRTIYGSDQILYPVDDTNYALKTFADIGIPPSPSITAYTITPDFTKFIVTVYNSSTSLTTKVYEMNWNNITVSRTFDVGLAMSPAMSGSSPAVVTTRHAPEYNYLIVQVSPDGGVDPYTGCIAKVFRPSMTGPVSNAPQIGQFFVDRWQTHPVFSEGGDYLSVQRNPENASEPGLTIYRPRYGTSGATWDRLPDIPGLNLYRELPINTRYLSLSNRIPVGPYKQLGVVGGVGARAVHVIGKRRDDNSWVRCYTNILQGDERFDTACTWTTSGWGLISNIRGSSIAQVGVRLLDIDPITGAPKGVPILKNVGSFGAITAAHFLPFGTTR